MTWRLHRALDLRQWKPPSGCPPPVVQGPAPRGGKPHVLAGLRRGLRSACLLLGFMLGGCTGYEQLSGAVATLNREIATLQDEVVLLNILRRSEMMPAHFSSVPLIRGRNRVTSGAGLTLPFGPGSNSRNLFEPMIEAETGPGFDFAVLNNDEFLQAMRSPVSMATLAAFLRPERRRDAILTVAIGSIRWRTATAVRTYAGDPESPEAFGAFQRRLESLIDQGLTTETALQIRNISPPFGVDSIPALGEIAQVQSEGLVTEELPLRPGERTRRYQLRRIEEMQRFCFAAPQEHILRLAGCGATSGIWRQRFGQDDPRAFGGASPVVFDAGPGGRIEIELRSPMQMLDFLGAVARLGRAGPEHLPGVRQPDGQRVPLFVVQPATSTTGAIATATLNGRRHMLPAGEAGGYSGEVFSFLNHLVGSAQSVLNVPMTGVVVGD